MAKLVEGLIAVMLGAILLFGVVVPVLNNANLGTIYEDELVTNATHDAASTIYTVSCMPLRDDVTYVTGANNTLAGTTITSQLSVYNADAGKLKWTNATGVASDNVYLTYRCLDGAYIQDSTARTVSSFLTVITIVLLLVGVAGMIYLGKE